MCPAPCTVVNRRPGNLTVKPATYGKCNQAKRGTLNCHLALRAPLLPFFDGLPKAPDPHLISHAVNLKSFMSTCEHQSLYLRPGSRTYRVIISRIYHHFQTTMLQTFSDTSLTVKSLTLISSLYTPIIGAATSLGLYASFTTSLQTLQVTLPGFDT